MRLFCILMYLFLLPIETLSASFSSEGSVNSISHEVDQRPIRQKGIDCVKNTLLRACSNKDSFKSE